ncbi:hypothetical protein MGYG_02501 [Nannizzia gypsea CBS 118893]|uniref:Uncharacterized protein n=1 Tax=Arthroderma gypseum (strain ATCC MYA-4604 / CBS 118893) TaxID=535722 RepID=E4UMX5_ARTGP|nr:hypothetical protein MGYG_02501 [Nannizzia gypsea CBS 118893]EFQ99489.1 hypothetical protein MGYG_02501 [Nannizzia gypsea CBS 118893]
MSSDAAYAAFLDKANEGLDNATTSNKQPEGQEGEDSGFISSKRLDVDEQQIPPSLHTKATYASETDMPFEPVVLHADHFPSADEFKQLAYSNKHDALEVSILSPTQFDPRGKYKEVIERVMESSSSDGSIQVYRVQHDHARVEYWLLAVDEGRLLGLKARAIET